MSLSGPERVAMKRAVFERDALTKGCHWCGRLFFYWDDCTLEHIIPLADGGEHSLENCALACEPCNLANVPRVVRAKQLRAREEKMNRIAESNGTRAPRPAKKCHERIEAQFDAIYRTRGGEPLTYGEAARALKTIHGRLQWPRPSNDQKRIFKENYNWWNQLRNNPPTIIDVPEGYVNPFAQ